MIQTTKGSLLEIQNSSELQVVTFNCCHSSRAMLEVFIGCGRNRPVYSHMQYLFRNSCLSEFHARQLMNPTIDDRQDIELLVAIPCYVWRQANIPRNPMYFALCWSGVLESLHASRRRSSSRDNQRHNNLFLCVLKQWNNKIIPQMERSVYGISKGQTQKALRLDGACRTGIDVRTCFHYINRFGITLQSRGLEHCCRRWSALDDPKADLCKLSICKPFKMLSSRNDYMPLWPKCDHSLHETWWQSVEMWRLHVFLVS